MRFYDTFNHVDAVPVSTTLCLHTISGPKFPSNLFPPIFMWSRKAKKRDILRSCQVKPMNLAFCYLSVTIFIIIVIIII